MSLEEQLKLFVNENEQLLRDLKIARELNLPDCFIAAGYIRNYIWDRLHGFSTREKHNDIDVIYFDLESISEENDQLIENRLIKQTLNEKWSIKNQARMHVKNENLPYKSTFDAIAHWPETATAVGVRLDKNSDLQVISPYGLEDLFDMVIRRSPLFKNKEYYMNRVESKGWKVQWPLLKLIED